MNDQMTIPHKVIAEFCRKWHIVEFALFGSVLRKDFRSESDIDVLVEFEPGSKYSLFDLVQMEDELRSIFGRSVDLLTKSAIRSSRNYLRRKAILGTAEVLYATG